MLAQNEGLLLIIFSIVFLVVISMVVLFAVFNERKNKLIQKSTEERNKFENELAKTQIEIREATLQNISWELHDNIGQLMTLAKIKAQAAQDQPQKIEEVAEVIGRALRELRALSKAINPENFSNLDLAESLKEEINRYDRVNFIKTSFSTKGTPFPITKKDKVILFRIMQEFFTNTIKHAKATELKLDLEYKNKTLIIKVEDNGKGFDIDREHQGMGLKNIKKRAEIVGGTIKHQSRKGKGTSLEIKYNEK